LYEGDPPIDINWRHSNTFTKFKVIWHPREFESTIIPSLLLFAQTNKSFTYRKYETEKGGCPLPISDFTMGEIITAFNHIKGTYYAGINYEHR
jgi:hypothetical protein